MVCALLLWGADALSRRAAETLVACDVQDAAGPDQRPVVHVHGALFLPWSAAPMTRSTPPPAASPTGRCAWRGWTRPSPGCSYLDATGQPLTLAPASGAGTAGQVRATGTLSVLGQRVPVSADLALSVADGQLRASPRSLDTGSATLDGASRALLGQRLAFTVPLQALPFGHHLTAVHPRAHDLLVTATGQDVVLSS